MAKSFVLTVGSTLAVSFLLASLNAAPSTNLANDENNVVIDMDGAAHQQVINPAAAPLDASSIIEVQGYKAIHRAETEAVGLAKAVNGPACLQNCRDAPRCGFVSYDNTTGHCQGFSKESQPFFESAPGYSLLTASKKTFMFYEGQDDASGDLVLEEQYRDYGVYGIDAPSAEVCVQLCQIYPKCNTASSATDNNGWRNCYLKSISLLNLHPNSNINTYHSVY